MAEEQPLVAVAGNPNTGKTTLFNALTGARQKVGNYPGITVDRHEGKLRLPDGGQVRIVDVPGSYSLSARSEEEQLALRAICGLPPHEAPDLVIAVVDATQLARNLYLVLQLIETEVPVVVALNMIDRLEGRGLTLDSRALERALEVPVVEVCARTGEGLERLEAALAQVLADPARGRPGMRWSLDDPLLEADVAAIEAELPVEWRPGESGRRRALALWALLSIDDQDELIGIPERLRETVTARRRLAQAAGRDLDLEVVSRRYGWIDSLAPTFLREASHRRGLSERVDALLLHPFLGFTLFLILMGVVFQSLFSWSDPAIGAIETSFDSLSGWVQRVLPEGLGRDFITEGLIAGVGSVLVFLPQILLLFLFIALMEDTGYMARVAFLMDRIMRSLGLHGRAFVPMMSGFACAVPAVMATRTMERRRDRLLTMMVVPLMTCAARLPVYTLVIGALFPPSEVLGFLPLQGLMMVGLYLFSTLMALVAAGVLSRTILRGPKVPLILELPSYRWPQPTGVLRTMLEKAWVFVAGAGTVILLCTIGLWLLLSFPREAQGEAHLTERRAAIEAAEATPETEAELAALDSELAALRLQESYAGRVGHALEPVIAPLGFDWKIGIGLIGSFAAREVFVATMGLVYGVGEEADEGSATLRERIRSQTHADGRPVYSPLVGISLLAFFALACQCLSTLAAVKRETGGWRWPGFMLAYMTLLAWGTSFVIYQGGRFLGFE